MLVKVNYETALPEISPMLLAFANLTLIDDLDAEASKKVMFLQALARDASNKNELGKAKVIHSMYRAKLNATLLMNRHFLISSSKFLPYLEANKIPPRGPTPSFKANVNAAAAIVAWV
jgi:hypothetical protein